jgi:hypothetical protein
MPRRCRIALVVLLGLALVTPLASAGPSRAGASAQAPTGLRLISYYPADGGWTLMWTNWRPERYATDFARIRSLGANAVRIVVQSSLFGFPQPDPLYLGRLRQMVELAAANGLRAQLTLFDWGSYDEIADIPGSEQWTEAVLAPYAGDGRIAAVELKNEIDPTDPVALAWARGLVPFAQGLLRHATPVTLSVSGGDPAASLETLKAALGSAQPDFYTLHLFGGGGETAYWTLRDAKAAVAPVPLWVGETGYPTFAGWNGYPDLPPTDSAREAAQAHYLKTMAVAAARNGLPPIGIWALSDFLPGAIPSADPGQLPSEAEYHYGLLRTDGSAKPAAAAVRRIFGGSLPLAFNGGFDQAVLDADGRPFPAEWSGTGSANARLTLDRRVAHGGSAAALVRSLDGQRTSGTLSIAPVEAAVPDGAHVRASVWVRVRGRGALVRLGLDWLGPKALHVKTTALRLTKHGSGWTQLRISARRPAVARAVRIELLVTGNRGSVWFDDVRFAVDR